MCGIIGAVLYKIDSESKTILKNLFYESKIRGMQSYGISIFNLISGLNTTKFDNIVCILNRIDFINNPSLIIGICRYPTSGIYNQPVHLKTFNKASLVFNGNIHMGSKEEMEREHGIQMETDNDGEIYIRKWMNNQKNFILSDNISFAGLLINEGSLYALRNSKRPLYRSRLRQNIFFASTGDIMKRAGLKIWSKLPETREERNDL